jgi:hypothetical protein
MLYNIVNPSDPYTIAAEDHDVVTAAAFLLGSGYYPVEPIDDGNTAARVPAFFHVEAADAWCQQTFGLSSVDLVDHVIAAKREALIACLDSCLIGTPQERTEFEAAMAWVEDPAKRADMKRKRHQLRVTSVNDIGRLACSMVDQLRETGEVA